MVLLAIPFVESLTLGLSAWGSVIGVFGAVTGFIALARGAPLREVEKQFVYGSVAGAPTGLLLGVATVVLTA